MGKSCINRPWGAVWVRVPNQNHGYNLCDHRSWHSARREEEEKVGYEDEAKRDINLLCGITRVSARIWCKWPEKLETWRSSLLRSVKLWTREWPSPTQSSYHYQTKHFWARWKKKTLILRFGLCLLKFGNRTSRCSPAADTALFKFEVTILGNTLYICPHNLYFLLHLIISATIQKLIRVRCLKALWRMAYLHVPDHAFGSVLYLILGAAASAGRNLAYRPLVLVEPARYHSQLVNLVVLYHPSNSGTTVTRPHQT